MPTPYPFVSGATLLASQMNSLSQLPTVSITANSTAVATHAYSRVIANGSAITYTIPNSVFEAGQVIEFHNINSTAATVAAGAGVTLNAAAGLTVAQYQSATIYATSASSFILFESAVTQTPGGLELIKTQTIGSAVASVTVSDVFSSTYDNYKITLTGGALSASYEFLRMQLGSTTTGYYSALISATYATGSVSGGNQSNEAFGFVGVADTNNLFMNLDLFAPNLAKRTQWNTAPMPFNVAGDRAYTAGGWQNSDTQFTAFTLTPSSGTLTGGTIRVYGYRN